MSSVAATPVSRPGPEASRNGAGAVGLLETLAELQQAASDPATSPAIVELLERHADAVLAAVAAWDHERDGLHQAIEGRDVIGQAKGILIARDGLTPEGAFEQLREHSQRSNRKLRELAAELVRSSGGNGASAAPPPPPARVAAPPRTP
jgi:hypothetical protein